MAKNNFIKTIQIKPQGTNPIKIENGVYCMIGHGIIYKEYYFKI